MPRTKKVIVSKTAAKGALKKPASKKIAKPTPWAGLTVRRPKNFSIGNDVQPKRNLRMFMKWPVYVNLQRKRQVLAKRLKIPAPIAQFRRTADKSLSNSVFKMLEKNKLPNKKERKEELEKIAAGESGAKKPRNIKFGIKEVVKSIEKKKAKLVVIAHDVDPIEIVLVIPGLCRKMGIPHVIVKGKARLGTFVDKKTATCLAITGASTNDLKPILEGIKARPDDFNLIGGGILSSKTNMKMANREKALKALQG